MFTFLADKTGFAKQHYCKSLYKVRTLYGYRDSYCENLQRISISKTLKQDAQLKEFSNNREQQAFFFNSTNPLVQTQITLPKDAEISEASITFALIDEITKTSFNDGSIQKTLLFPVGGGTKTIYITLPKNAIIKDARFELSGREMPAYVDQVFVIDTSESMSNEWNTLCANINLLEELLIDLNINVTTRIFGIGGGSTHGNCMTRQITKDELRAQLGGITFNEDNTFTCLQGGVPFDQCRSVANPFDDYTESWGLALLWVINDYNGWRSDAKKIVYPISDSDPTGGGQIIRDPPKWPAPPHLEGDAVLSGNEEQVIDKVISMAGDVHVFPIYGDLGPIKRFNEGFNMGVPENECRTTYANTCGKILAMMEELAQETDGNVTAYKDIISLRDTILNAVTLPFPTNIQARVSSFDWNFPYELNQSNSPQIVTGQALVQSIQNQLNSCGTEICTIPITISTSSEGAIIVDKPRIDYVQELDDVRLRIGQVGQEIQNIALTKANPTQTFNITTEVEQELELCHNTECDIPITIRSPTQGGLMIKDLSVEYKKYFVEEELLRYIIDCWTKSGYGKSSLDEACEEVVIPIDYKFLKPITEQSITDIMIERQICHLMANSDLGCGEKDNLKFTKDINTTGNVLIEYKGAKKQVVVS